MKKLTLEEFNAMSRDERGYLHIPDETDCTEINFDFAIKIIFGNWCKLGNECTLGDWCKLGNECTLGDGCTLGNWCTLGEYINCRATFENGNVKNGLYVKIGNIGSEHRTAYFYIDETGRMFVRAGCWFSDMEKFKARVHDVHGGTLYEMQYIAACVYAESVLPLMLECSNDGGTTHD